MLRNDENFKILSIDGGGIKGLYSAVILAEFEEKHGQLSNHFDLICGTSTGGIIALGLAAGIPAKDIVNLYQTKGPTIFPEKKGVRKKLQTIKQALFASKYSEDNLKSALEDVFKDKKIGDCKTNVLIPTANITTGQPCIIKNDHSGGLERDNIHSLVDVALATTAAPTYFPIQEIPTMSTDYQYTDGGIYANNPSLHGIQEAYKFFINKNGHSYKNYSLLSVSTLHENFSFKRKLSSKRLSLLSWNVKLISLMMDLQSVSTDFHIQYLNSTLNGRYVRIKSESLTEEESKLIDLDKAGKESIDLLIKKGHEASSKWIDNPEILEFFNQYSKI